MDKQKKQSTEGEPMSVESLMNSNEWSERMRNFPKTSHFSWADVNKNKPNSFKWRYAMGKFLTPEEIEATNKRLEELRAYGLSKKTS